MLRPAVQCQTVAGPLVHKEHVPSFTGSSIKSMQLIQLMPNGAAILPQVGFVLYFTLAVIMYVCTVMLPSSQHLFSSHCLSVSTNMPFGDSLLKIHVCQPAACCTSQNS